MKRFITSLALGLALLPFTSVHAAPYDPNEDLKNIFIDSLHVTLSPAERTRLDTLTRAYAKADDDYNKAGKPASDSDLQLYKAERDKASPVVIASLKKQKQAAFAALETATQRRIAASNSLDDFKAIIQLPKAVRRVMRPGAVTLGSQQWLVGPKTTTVLLHISVVPQMKVIRTQGRKIRAIAPKTPSELFDARNQLSVSPFIVDVFESPSDKKDAPFRLVNSRRFYSDRIVGGEFRLNYLRPNTKGTPFVWVGYLDDRSTQTWTLTFPNGLRGPMREQSFPYACWVTQPNARGLVALESKKYSHTWNGQRFVAKPKVLARTP